MNTEVAITNNEKQLAQLKTSVAKTQREQPRVGNDPFLKMGKDGVWTFGQEGIRVEDGSVWAIDPFSYHFGYTCWTDYSAESKKKNVNMGKQTVAMGMEPIDINALPKHIDADSGVEWPWSQVIEMALTCTDGEDKGVKVLYQTSSMGGLRAGSDYLDLLAKNIPLGNPVALVTLGSETYNHNQWGKIYTPAIDYKEWRPLDDTSAAPALEEKGDTAEAEISPQAPPARRRRPAA